MLQQQQIDGWLLYALHHTNPLALNVLELPSTAHITRRCFYWIPASGKPKKIVHRIEAKMFNHLSGERLEYSSWKEMHQCLKEVIGGKKKVAMEFSPMQAIPTLSCVDAGLVELISSMGPKVVSSASLLQALASEWIPEHYASHVEAAQFLDALVQEQWNNIRQSILQDKKITEYDIQQDILKAFERNGYVTEAKPICAVNENSADPHYSPSQAQSKEIKKGDFIMIDLWCRKDHPRCFFADMTRVAVAAIQPSPKQQEIFSIVLAAQKAGIALIESRYKKGIVVSGAEVDQVVRGVIEERGYGEFFTHRTGHSITDQLHGPGANLDSFETDDSRPLIPNTCSSIEPGIYLPGEFGVRLESDLWLHEGGRVEVIPSMQESLITLL